METLKRIFIASATFISVFIILGISQTYSNDFDDLETQIIAESSEKKIKKLQTFFQKLDLYNGEIDGKYNSVLPSLLAYQKQTGLIQSNTDWGAGYFWVQTLTALQEDYPSDFETYRYILKEDEPEQWERYFYVTAYYSPLPNQNRYTTGTYWWDVRLNGEWKHTASWKWVFTGLLAAPRNYDFGTKIELEGIWVGSVEDRGWAIVNAWERWHEYDRIDIWMGYGDEWLARALKWWKRKVKGKVVSDDRTITVKFNQSPVAAYSNLYVTPESDWVNVKKLQQLFTDLKLYDDNIDGKYISIEDELIDFQLQHKIISSKYDEQAGYFGKRTIAALESIHGTGNEIFEEPVKIEYPKAYVLTRKQKQDIIIVKNKIEDIFEKKYSGNKVKIKNAKTQLQAKLDKIIKKSRSNKDKAVLTYLKIVL